MFTWIPFYEELASMIINYRNQQNDLIDILKELKAMKLPIINLFDKDKNGEVPLDEIDPFTFFATFNRGIKDQNRIDILTTIKDRLQIRADVPSDFEGIPVVSMMQARFFLYKKDRNPGDIEALWDLAEAAAIEEIDTLKKDLFNRCIETKTIGIPKLTMGLFWLRPMKFMPLDKRSREFFKKKGIATDVSDFDSYKIFLQNVRGEFKDSFPEISRKAYDGDGPPEEIRYWQIAPGENARLWSDLRFNSIAAVGWTPLNFDLTRKSKAELSELYKKYYPNETDRQAQIGTTMLWNFLNLQPGDKFITNKGRSLLLGLGKVKGTYKFRPEREEYKHTVDVDYYVISETGIPIPEKSKGKFGRTITPLTKEEFQDFEVLFSPPKNFWIFQANPKYYDMEGALKTCKEFSWGIAQHKEKIRKGDEVYLWLSGPNAGFYATAEVLTNPGPLPDEPCEEPFIKKPEKFENERPRVRLSIKRVLGRPVSRAMILEKTPLKNLTIITSPQGTNFLLTPEEADLIERLINDGPDTSIPNPVVSLSQIAEETGFSKGILERWIRAIERKGQAIIYGPPGTGKTFIAEKLALHLIGGGYGFKDLVQFHPAYSYEDFVQGIRPKARFDGKLDYPIVPGRFFEFCNKAQSCEGLCVLLIDEINRANLAQVFGELMFLLEYRSREVPLASGGIFHIPENVRVIGTMNTADRSIALVDHALRRRFAFWALYPDYDVLRKYHENKNTKFPVDNLIKTLIKLNNQIDDRNYTVGITFFLMENLLTQIEDIWIMEIEPYLEEYFFDKLDHVSEFRWDKIKHEIIP